MRRLASAILAATILAWGMGAALAAAGDPRVEADKPAKRVIVAIDLSASNPLLKNPGFAAKVGARVRQEIESLGFSSEVHVRTFGAYGAGGNNFYYDTVISTRARPETVAADVERLIAGTPKLVKSGKWKAQGTTNILAFLDNAIHSFGCDKLPTDIILATDGIEDSEYAHLLRKNAKLPEVTAAAFKGCGKLEILGLGQGQKSPAKTTQLRDEWTRWGADEGFASVVGLNDW